MGNNLYNIYKYINMQPLVTGQHSGQPTYSLLHDDELSSLEMVAVVNPFFHINMSKNEQQKQTKKERCWEDGREKEGN